MNEKILLIDDDPAAMKLTTWILELAGYIVVSAANEDEAICLLQQECPDLVLCDMTMSGLSGYSVLRWLMNSPLVRKTSFIFLTPCNDRCELRKAMQMGADDYIVKPFLASDLLSSIDTRIKKKKGSMNPAPDQGIVPLHQSRSVIEEFYKMMSAVGKSVNYEKDTPIFNEGEINCKVLLVTSGSIKKYKINEMGKSIVTGIYTGGDVACNKSFSEKYNNNSMVAIERTEGMLASWPEVQTGFSENIKAATGYSILLSRKIPRIDKQLISVAFSGVRKRIAEALLRLENIYYSRAGVSRIPLPLADLAYITGMTSESAYRVLSAFEKEGLIQKDHKGNIVIISPEHLQNLPDGKRATVTLG